MNFKVTIKEFSKGVVDVEAESIDEAKKKVEEYYCTHPNYYLLEPYYPLFDYA